MAVKEVLEDYKGLVSTLGRAALHATFPNDFEYYAITLELTDSTDKLINALTFPVMPTSISEFKQDISNQKKSSAGVVSLYDTTFVPFDISLSGTFGRKLRLLVGAGFFTAIASAIKSPSSLLGKGEEDPPAFNISIKSGYGAIKLLEKIRKESFGIDKEGAPVRLYLYNLALNSQYLVEFKSLRIMQDQANNMLWNYQANFKAIAPAYSIRNTKLGTLTTLGASAVSAGMNQLASNAF